MNTKQIVIQLVVGECSQKEARVFLSKPLYIGDTQCLTGCTLDDLFHLMEGISGFHKLCAKQALQFTVVWRMHKHITCRLTLAIR